MLSAASTRATIPHTTRTSTSASPFVSTGTASSTNRPPRLTHAESSSTTPPYKVFLLEYNRRRLVQRWATVLSELEPLPLAERATAIARSVARSPVGSRAVPSGTPTDRGTCCRADDGESDRPADLTGLALASSLAELAVQSAYIAELEAAVDRLGSDLDRHTKMRRSLRRAETTLANLLPVGVKEWLRGWLPNR